MDELFVQNSVLAIALGFMIGLEREMHVRYANKKRDFGGARTFAMISLFGYLSAWITAFVPNFFLISTLVLGALLIGTYVINSVKSQDKGATTEFSAIVAFLIGSMPVFVPVMLAVFTTIMVLFILNIKEKLQEYEQTIVKQDLNAAIMFMMMSFVVLPVLPDKAIDAWGLINLYRIWLMVVLVAGISFFGYICIRFFKTAHGIGVAGFFGGLVSSTAVAMSMARQAKDGLLLIKNLAIAITLACSVMLVRAWIEVWVIHPELSYRLVWAVGASTVAGYAVIGYFFLTAKAEQVDQSVVFKNPFELKEALLMGLIFGLILALIGLAKQYVGNAGVYAISLISGMADIDAIVLSLSSLSKNGLAADTAINGIMLATVSNSITKLSIVWVLGGWGLARYVALYFAATIPLFCLILSAS